MEGTVPLLGLSTQGKDKVQAQGVARWAGSHRPELAQGLKPSSAPAGDLLSLVTDPPPDSGAPPMGRHAPRDVNSQV